jgi:excisionase family DNA binding protein
MKTVNPPPEWLTPAEVARKLRVERKTVSLWAENGRIPAVHVIRTPGGHRRYRASYIGQLTKGGRS